VTRHTTSDHEDLGLEAWYENIAMWAILLKFVFPQQQQGSLQANDTTPPIWPRGQEWYQGFFDTKTPKIMPKAFMPNPLADDHVSGPWAKHLNSPISLTKDLCDSQRGCADGMPGRLEIACFAEGF
jgi:hypothetical protein